MEPLDMKLNASATILTASASERTITGDIIQFGVVGYASLGACIFEAGSIEVPEKLSKVKMLMQHDFERPVGILASFKDKGEFAEASFTIPATPEGDKALLDAASGLRDGLSVGVQILEYKYDDDDNLIVIKAKLTEVSLVTVPAFENALVNKVAAQRKEGNKMETEETTPVTVEAAAPAAPSVEVIERQAAPVIVAAAGGIDLHAAAKLTIAHMLAGGTAATLAAALTDVVPADDAGQGFLRPTFIGELWQAARNARPLIDAFQKDKLTGTKVYGWKWDLANSPKVGRYAGNKTAVPSSNLKTVAVEGDAQDFAAGWDVARKYIDLGATGYIEAVFKGAVADYMLQTETWFGEQIIAAATPLPGVTTVVGALGTMSVEAAKVGAQITTLQFGEDVWEEFVNLKSSEVPWWLTQQGEVKLDGLSGSAGGVKFSANVGLEADQILGADGRAATFYEAGTPIRVQALDIPRGGVDLGVFGYAGAIIHDPRAILLGEVAAGA